MRSARGVGATDAPDDDHPVKGNEDSMKYHVPARAGTTSSVAEVWFAAPRTPRPRVVSPVGGAAARRSRSEPGLDVSEEENSGRPVSLMVAGLPCVCRGGRNDADMGRVVAFLLNPLEGRVAFCQMRVTSVSSPQIEDSA